MPIGPSHGSRGGRSSFSGGSSGGSRRSGGSNLGGAILGGIIYSMFANRRRRRYEQVNGDGENQLPYRPRPTKYLVFAIIFAVFAAITMIFRSAFVSTMNSYQETLDIIKTDYTNEYKPMIDAVKNYEIPVGQHYVDCGNGYYKTVASFKNSSGYVSVFSTYSDNPQAPGAYLDFEEDGISYYFIVYRYIDHNGDAYIGTTYTQFSASQYTNLGGQIEIAYHSKTGGERYSINTNYLTYETAEYENYEDVVESNKSAATIFLIAFVVELALIALFVFLYVKKLKKYKVLVKQDEELFLQKRQAEADKAQAEAEGAQIEAQRKNRFCQYCGSQIDENTNTCTSCGAKFSNDN